MLVGASASVLSPASQTRLMDVAGDNQSIAAALNHSALNIGNSLGAFLGGAAISLGFGFTAPEWVGAVLAALGLAIVLIAYRAQSSAPVAAAVPPARVAPGAPVAPAAPAAPAAPVRDH